jgi:hypothetical protein
MGFTAVFESSEIDSREEKSVCMPDKPLWHSPTRSAFFCGIVQIKGKYRDLEG